MPWDDDTITPKVLLEHIQAMRGDLTVHIDGLVKRMEQGFERVNRRFEGVNRRFEGIEAHLIGMEKNIGNIKISLQRLYSHRLDMLGRIEYLEKVTGVAQ